MNSPQTQHGVLLSIFGLGVLVTGKSAAGKSELALQLLDRGHVLIADDICYLKRLNSTLMGYCPEALFELLAIRDVGIINVRHRYGQQACQQQVTIDLVLELNTNIGAVTATTQTWLGVTVPKVITSSLLQQQLALWLETKVFHLKEAQAGYDAEQILAARTKSTT